MSGLASMTLHLTTCPANSPGERPAAGLVSSASATEASADSSLFSSEASPLSASCEAAFVNSERTTSELGRKPSASSITTLKPPFTSSMMTASMIVLAFLASMIFFHARCERAHVRESTTRLLWSARMSTAASISSPALSSPVRSTISPAE